MAQSVLSFVDPAACWYKNTDNYKYSPFPSAIGAIISSYESQKWEMNLTSWVGNWIEARNQVEIQISALSQEHMKVTSIRQNFLRTLN